MLSIYAFWALLWLPGYAAVRRWAPAEAERGALSAVALGYAATLLLIAPWALLCYALRLPVWVFSVAVGALIVAGAVATAATRPWRGWSLKPAPELVLGAVLICVQLWLAGRLGGWLDGDATYHVGRIRDLLDHGFSNRDFYAAEESWNRAYPCNLMHALFAAAAQLTRQDLLLVWFASLPWAQLVIAAAHYHLAHVLFERRSAGWLAAVIVTVLRAPETYALYPNLLAVGWLAPLVLAYAFAAYRRPALRSTPIALGALAFVLSQVHVLYWPFCVLAAAPLLAARLGLARRDPPRARWLALCFAGLLAGAPMTLLALHDPQPSAAQQHAANERLDLPFELPAPADRSKERSSIRRNTAALAAGGGHLEKELAPRAGGGHALPLEHAGGLWFLLSGALALALCLRSPRVQREPAIALAVAAATLLALPTLPATATWLARHGMPEFGVARMVTLACTLLLVAIGGALALGIERLARPRLALAAALVLAAGVSTQLLGHAPRAFTEHVRQAFAGRTARHLLLDEHRARRELLRKHVPAGALVLASLRDARYLVMLHDARVLAADRGHARIYRLKERRIQVATLTHRKTEWPLRSKLLEHHRLRFVVFRDKQAKHYAWTTEHGRLLGSAGGWQLVALDGLHSFRN